jgi:NAD(P)-dependent dehydrogenase (short-subunit alcohol dehydrogenase family)
VARVFVSGSTTGLGRAAAEDLLDGGHHVVLHARNRERAAAIDDLAPRAVGVVLGDLASRAEVRIVADQVNDLGPVDAVIHNAAIYVDRERVSTPEGHARTLAVNVLAPYLLTAWIERPSRLLYLSSDMHRTGDTSLRDIDWTQRQWRGVQAYCDSKLFIVACCRAGSAMARLRRQRRRPRLGTDSDGRRRRSRRPRARPSHPDVARRLRQRRGDDERRLLAPPAAPSRGTRIK